MEYLTLAEAYENIGATSKRLEMTDLLVELLGRTPKEEVEKVEELARKTTHEVRTMLFTLRPVVLETQGLAAALEQYGERLRQNEDLNVEVDSEDYDGQLDKQAESVVFAVVEESVGNAKKHAHANNVLIRLCVDRNLFTAEIRDDGVGFDVDQAYRRREAGHMGLLNLEERAGYIGGRCVIESQVGAGTVVRFDVPLRG